MSEILNIIPGQAVPESYFSAGIHPWYAKSTSADDLHPMLLSENCVAIGECGLDAVKSSLTLEDQKMLFRAHLEIARKFSKPVILHVVRCTNELFGIVNDFPDLTYIWHGYNGNQETLRQFERFNMFFSFGMGGLTKPDLWRSMPDDRMLCETDDREDSIMDVYESLANIRGEHVEIFAGIVEANIKKIFGHELG